MRISIVCANVTLIHLHYINKPTWVEWKIFIFLEYPNLKGDLLWALWKHLKTLGGYSKYVLSQLFKIGMKYFEMEMKHSQIIQKCICPDCSFARFIQYMEIYVDFIHRIQNLFGALLLGFMNCVLNISLCIMLSLDDVMLHKALVDFLQNMGRFQSFYVTRKVMYDSPNNT